MRAIRTKSTASLIPVAVAAHESSVASFLIKSENGH